METPETVLRIIFLILRRAGGELPHAQGKVAVRHVQPFLTGAALGDAEHQAFCFQKPLGIGFQGVPRQGPQFGGQFLPPREQAVGPGFGKGLSRCAASAQAAARLSRSAGVRSLAALRNCSLRTSSRPASLRIQVLISRSPGPLLLTRQPFMTRLRAQSTPSAAQADLPAFSSTFQST